MLYMCAYLVNDEVESFVAFASSEDLVQGLFREILQQVALIVEGAGSQRRTCETCLRFRQYYADVKAWGLVSPSIRRRLYRI